MVIHLAVLIFSLLALLPAAVAQGQGKIWRIGLFHVGLDHVPPPLDPLRQTLKTLGYEEGKNLRFDWRNLPGCCGAAPVIARMSLTVGDVVIGVVGSTMRQAIALVGLSVSVGARLLKQVLPGRIMATYAIT